MTVLLRKKRTRKRCEKREAEPLSLPGAAGPLGPQSAPPSHPAGPCTAPGSGPSPRVLGWPGSRCALPRPPCRAASAEDAESDGGQ